jgi:UDP-N-acetylmuramate dehydrogenase
MFGDCLVRVRMSATLVIEMPGLPPSHMRLEDIQAIKAAFGERLQEHTPLERFTAARIGGPADFLLEVTSADELAQAASLLWELELPFVVLGGGSNVLVSDAGVREVIILNRARRVHFDEQATPPTAWAESGANFGTLARQAAQRGLAGLEWAAGIPGTVGGAVVGNAGAHGGDAAGNLLLAEILHHTGETGSTAFVRSLWPVEKMDFTYRNSSLKRQPMQAVVLSALLRLERGDPQAVQARLDAFVAQRRRTQPKGASMGSMFKNPPGDYAGRLIEAAGLKGYRTGSAQISPLHANFFINQGGASAADIRSLIELAQQTVADRFGVKLELEIELVGEWS